MPKQNIGIRVPDDVLAAIDARCKARGLSRTDAVLELIQQGLDSASASAASATNNAKGALYRDDLEKKSPSWVIR